MKKKDGFDGVIAWMEQDGMMGRIRRQIEIDKAAKDRRRLNKKIREQKLFLEVVNG